MAIASGPNGDEWVTDNVDQDYGNSAVVEVTTSGKRVRVFDAYGIESEGTFLSDIAVGKDGALWITDSYNRQILRMTTKGTFTGYRLTLRETPDSIAAGPDKALWFTSNGDTPSIGRITTDGAITMYSQGISAGAQLNLYRQRPGRRDVVYRVGRRSHWTDYRRRCDHRILTGDHERLAAVVDRGRRRRRALVYRARRGPNRTHDDGRNGNRILQWHHAVGAALRHCRRTAPSALVYRERLGRLVI